MFVSDYPCERICVIFLFQLHDCDAWYLTVRRAAAEPHLRSGGRRSEAVDLLQEQHSLHHGHAHQGSGKRSHELMLFWHIVLSSNSCFVYPSVVIPWLRLLPFRCLKMEQIPTRMWKPTCFQIRTRLPSARQRSRGKPETLLSMRWFGNNTFYRLHPHSIFILPELYKPRGLIFMNVNYKLKFTLW